MPRKYVVDNEKFGLLLDYFSRYLRESRRSGEDMGFETRRQARMELNELIKGRFTSKPGAIIDYMDKWMPEHVQRRAKLAVRQQRNKFSSSKMTKTIRLEEFAASRLEDVQKDINMRRVQDGERTLNRSEVVEALCKIYLQQPL